MLVILIPAVRWFTLICFASWLIIYWQGGQKVLHDISSSVKLANSRLDTALIIVMALLAFIVAITGSLACLGQLEAHLLKSEAAAAVGCGLTVLGIGGTFYCRHYLGRFWTAETSLIQDHQVVDQGPYGVVRHPIYTFAILMYMGLGFVFSTWWNLLAVGIIAISYMVKAWDEDGFLEQSLPGYREYQRHVPYRLIPNLW